ncbi:MAG: DUF4139 domain-containing protein [Ferruginibacter sp.]
MKQLIFLPFAVFAMINLATAQKKDTVYTTAALQKTTVYYGYGADLSHKAKVNLVSGMQQVIISQVSFQPDINTLQISCPEDVTILSYTHRIYSKPAPTIPPGPTTKWLDSIRVYQKQEASIANDIVIQQEMLLKTSHLIDHNFTTPDKKNIVGDELIKLTNFYTDKINLIRKTVYDLTLRKQDCANKISELNQRINEYYQKEQDKIKTASVGQFIVQVLSKNAGPAELDLNYYTRTAGWAPSYDIRVKTLDNAMKLVYKAMVNNTTGLDWSGVKLNLSTSNPNQGTNLPSLTPTYLQLYFPQVYSVAQLQSITQDNDQLNPPVQLDAVTITAYNQKKDAFKTNTGAATSNNVQDYTTLSESQLNTNYEIDLPYEIPSDGIPYSVTIKEEKVTAQFQHTSIPKLDEDAFLMARLSRWDSLNLLPGQANVIMDNVYLGKTYLNPNTTEDTLALSLGRDKRISINREIVKEVKTPKKGEKKTETYTVEITLKNNKKQAVEIHLKDQHPVSKVNEIEVELTEAGGAEILADDGIMDWRVTVNPGESKKIKFVYQIKFPKDKVLQEYK